MTNMPKAVFRSGRKVPWPLEGGREGPLASPGSRGEALPGGRIREELPGGDVPGAEASAVRAGGRGKASGGDRGLAATV